MFINRKGNFVNPRKLLLASCVVALGFGNPSFTQETDDQTRRLEEIVVTAQKRTESLQDIPIAVTVHDGSDIEADNVESLLGIGSQTPGLVFTAFSVGQPEISIRGVSTKEDGASANDSVVVSVDDVYIAARTAQVFDIFDLERVEVLRGPQGTLYGKNSIGGSINFVTKKPTADTSVRFRQSFGNYGIFDSAGLVSGAISGNLFGKFSFSRRKHDGFLTNILPTSPDYNKAQGERDNFAIRGQFVYLPNDDLEMVISIDSADDSHGATNREPIGSRVEIGSEVTNHRDPGFHGNNNASDPVGVNKQFKGDGDAFTTLAETEGYTDRNVMGFSVKSTYSGGANADFISITSFRQSEFDWLEDSSGLPPSSVYTNLASGELGWTGPTSQGFAFDITNSAIEETQQITQELRLVSTTQGQLSWIAGAFFSKEDIDRTERFTFTSIGIGSDPDDQQSVQSNTTNSYAAYGQAEYEISEQLTFTGGLRVSSEKKDITVSAEKLTDNVRPLLLTEPFDPATASEEFSNVSWKASLDYQVNEDVLVYGNLATGFKSGGFTGSASSERQATTPFDSEQALSFEAGVKSRLADNRMLFNALAYATQYKDLQVTRFYQPDGNNFGAFITENAGEAEIQGLEIEAVGILSENFEVGGNLAWLNAEFVDFTGAVSTGADRADFNGNKLRLAPETTFSLYVQGDFDLDSGARVTAKAKYRYQDDMFFDPNNNPITVSPAHSLVDVWFAYTTPDNRIEMKAFVNNATDEEYVTHAFSQRGSRIAFGLFGPPMTYGVAVTYKYN